MNDTAPDVDTTVQHRLVEATDTENCFSGNEAAVSPLAEDLDWSLCAPSLREEFLACVYQGAIISEKDRHAGSLSDWQSDPRSANFRYSELPGTGS